MNRNTEIFRIADELANISTGLDRTPLDKLKEVADEVGKSWSGSWLGYHSRVYYKDLQPVPPGARFSKERGFMETISSPETIGEWIEYDFDYVVNIIYQMAGNPNLDRIINLAKQATDCFDDSQSRLLSFLSPVLQEHKNDPFLKDIVEKIKNLKIFCESDLIKYLTPSGKQFTYDMTAAQAGFQSPPHISIIARIFSLLNPFNACEELSKLAKRVASHLENIVMENQRERRIKTHDSSMKYRAIFSIIFIILLLVGLLCIWLYFDKKPFSFKQEVSKPDGCRGCLSIAWLLFLFFIYFLVNYKTKKNIIALIGIGGIIAACLIGYFTCLD